MVKNYWLKVKNPFLCKNTDKREKSKGKKVFFSFLRNFHSDLLVTSFLNTSLSLTPDKHWDQLQSSE